MAYAWPESSEEIGSLIGDWAHAVLLGPGLGRGRAARALVEGILTLYRGPVVLDADALNVFAGDAATLSRLLGRRAALVTPHVAELGRLAGLDADAVLQGRFDVGVALARTLGAVVLLKGVPTVVTDVGGDRIVAPFGTPALATGGSGDVLAGIATVLLAQTGDPVAAGVCAAWAQGRAAERASEGRALRGVALDDIVAALGGAWSLAPRPPRPPVLAELPPVGEP
jgi:NAD(P)H-hydrate epimerase